MADFQLGHFCKNETELYSNPIRFFVEPAKTKNFLENPVATRRAAQKHRNRVKKRSQRSFQASSSEAAANWRTSYNLIEATHLRRLLLNLCRICSLTSPSFVIIALAIRQAVIKLASPRPHHPHHPRSDNPEPSCFCQRHFCPLEPSSGWIFFYFIFLNWPKIHFEIPSLLMRF